MAPWSPKAQVHRVPDHGRGAVWPERPSEKSHGCFRLRLDVYTGIDYLNGDIDMLDIDCID